ncbi:MAG: alpha/beta hydrolase, partial [Phormidesmis sp.]
MKRLSRCAALAAASSLLLGCDRLSKTSAIQIDEDIEFATVDVAGESKSLQLDLYRPEQVDVPAAGWPVIVYIHGGGWVEQSRRDCPGEQLSGYGYAIACVSYRYSSEATFPAQIHDVKGAVRWLRAHAQTYQLNPDKVGAFGESAGGHLSALLGTSAGIAPLEGPHGYSELSSAVQAVADWYGPTDFAAVPLAFGNTPSDQEFEVLRDRPWAYIT